MSAFGGKADIRVDRLATTQSEGESKRRMRKARAHCGKNALYMRSITRGGAENGGRSAPESGRSSQRKTHSCFAGAQAQCRVSMREYLTEREIERLIEATKGNRWGHRDATMVLLAFRHGLRAAELVDLRLGAGGPGKRHPARP